MTPLDIKSTIPSDVVRSKFSRIDPRELSHLTDVQYMFPNDNSPIVRETATITTVDGAVYPSALIYGISNDTTTTVVRKEFLLIQRVDPASRAYRGSPLKLWMNSIHKYVVDRKQTAYEL